METFTDEEMEVMTAIAEKCNGGKGYVLLNNGKLEGLLIQPKDTETSIDEILYDFYFPEEDGEEVYMNEEQRKRFLRNKHQAFLFT